MSTGPRRPLQLRLPEGRKRTAPSFVRVLLAAPSCGHSMDNVTRTRFPPCLSFPDPPPSFFFCSRPSSCPLSLFPLCIYHQNGAHLGGRTERRNRSRKMVCKEGKKGTKRDRTKVRTMLVARKGGHTRHPTMAGQNAPFPGDRLSPRRRLIAKGGLEAFLASWLNFPESGIFSHRAENVSPSWLNFPDLGKFSPEGKRQKYPRRTSGRTIPALSRSTVLPKSSVNSVLPVPPLPWPSRSKVHRCRQW